MARLYKLEIQRDIINAVLYYNDDGTLDLVDADSGMPIEYLQKKLIITKELFEWMSKYDVISFECTKE